MYVLPDLNEEVTEDDMLRWFRKNFFSPLLVVDVLFCDKITFIDTCDSTKATWFRGRIDSVFHNGLSISYYFQGGRNGAEWVECCPPFSSTVLCRTDGSVWALALPFGRHGRVASPPALFGMEPI